MQHCSHVSLLCAPLLYPDSAQMLLHEDAGHRAPDPEHMLTPSCLHETVGLVKIDGGKRGVEPQIARTRPDRGRFCRAQQRRSGAAASRDPSHIHRHAMLTSVVVMT